MSLGEKPRKVPQVRGFDKGKCATQVTSPSCHVELSETSLIIPASPRAEMVRDPSLIAQDDNITADRESPA
jgi:hypothetical protein